MNLVLFHLRRVSSVVAAFAILALCINTTSALPSRVVPQAEVEPVTLIPGVLHNDALAGGDRRRYQVWAEAGQFVQVRVDQDGIDVDLTVRSSDDRVLAQIDRPNGIFGPEVLSWVAAVSAWYKLDVRSAERHATSGKFTVLLERPRAITARDSLRLDAEAVSALAERRRAGNTSIALEQAIDAFTRATTLWRNLEEPYEEAIALYGLGWSQNTLCRYEDAAESYDEATKIMAKLVDAHGEAISLTGSAYAHMYLGDTAGAAERFRRALDLRRQMSNKRGEAMALYGIGAVESLTGDDDRALDHFFHSLELRKEVEDRLGMAVTLVGIGKVHRHQGKDREALYQVNQALDIFRELKNGVGEADALSNIGWIHYELGELDEAFNSLTLALTRAREVGDPGAQALTLYGLARVDDSTGRRFDAQQAMSSALEIIEELRSRVSNESLRTKYFGSVQEYYDFALELQMRLHAERPGEGFDRAGFDVAERARARVLLDRLAESHGDLLADVSPELIKREHAARAQLNAITEYRSSRFPRSPEADDADQKVAESRQAYDDVRAAIRRSSPRWASLHERPAQWSDVQKLLEPDTLLIEYAFSENGCYLWTISNHEITGRRLAATPAAIRAAVNRLVRRYGAVDGGAIGMFEEDALSLSRMIMPSDIAGLMNRHRTIVVVPSGPLQSVPFTALSTARSPAPYVPLVANHDVVYLPSASTLVEIRKSAAMRTAHKLDSIAVFADPVFSAADRRISRHVPTQPPQLVVGPPRRLSGTHQEAVEISRLAPSSKLFLDFDANLEAATAEALSDSQIIHFATHGVVPEGHPEDAAIILSLVTNTGEPRDGYLGLPAIYGLRLPVELVVLSACDTSVGRDVKGEGVADLARGFITAGSLRVVATLWKVRDAASVEMMRRFYEALFNQRLSPAAALRVAAASMWKERRWAPSDWSAFVIFGDWR